MKFACSAGDVNVMTGKSGVPTLNTIIISNLDMIIWYISDSFNGSETDVTITPKCKQKLLVIRSA